MKRRMVSKLKAAAMESATSVQALFRICISLKLLNITPILPTLRPFSMRIINQHLRRRTHRLCSVTVALEEGEEEEDR